MPGKKKLLIVDDEENMRHFLKALLEQEGYNVFLAENGRAAIDILKSEKISTTLCDIRMPEMDGIEFLKEISAKKIDTTVITMSAYGTIDLAIETMKLGAYDYVSKPFKPDEILLTLIKAEERESLKSENVNLRKEVEQKYSFHNIVGKSPEITNIFDTIKKISDFKSSVLLTGESGTGKELIAKAIHYNSSRKEKPFLAVNCGAIPEALLESELFGHKKGSFTGAINDRKGIFEEANKGTLLLDEIGDIPINLQVKLLRVLQESETRRIGMDTPTPVDVRIIAATAKDLAQEVSNNTFREDLYYRLNVLPIHIPALRERKYDIPLLVKHFIEKYNQEHNLNIKPIKPSVLKVLIEHSWPGNIRELENIIERSMILAQNDNLDLNEMKNTITSLRETNTNLTTEGIYSIKKTVRTIEEKLIAKALQKTGGNKSRAAKLLEISYPSLLSKIEEYEIGGNNRE
jgi:two-component system response regulator AtoC